MAIVHLPYVHIDAPASSMREMNLLKGVTERNLVVAVQLVVVPGQTCRLLTIDVALRVVEEIG